MNLRYTHLDTARGLAALAVLVSHLRAFLFVDYPKLHAPSLPTKVFYFLTGFGHEAVMVFFVLSGFLITKGVVERRNAWHWGRYATLRMTRLWIVLIPSLLLTLLWNWLGQHALDSDYYRGLLAGLYHSGPASLPMPLGLREFLGNIGFLQTIRVPTYGDNGPLWSLANEFWYYVMFPLAFFAIASRTLKAKFGHLAILIAIALWLPGHITHAGLIWLLGYGVYLAHGKFPAKIARAPIFFIGASGAFALAMSLGRAEKMHGFAGELAIGFSFALLMLSLLAIPTPQKGWYKPTFETLSDFSYTLYLAHFPLVAFVVSWLFKNRQFTPGIRAYAIFLALMVASTLYAYLVYLLFERNTGRVRAWIDSKLFGPRSQPQATI